MSPKLTTAPRAGVPGRAQAARRARRSMNPGRVHPPSFPRSAWERTAGTLRVAGSARRITGPARDAERPGRHSHAERGNEATLPKKALPMVHLREGHVAGQPERGRVEAGDQAL